MQTESTQPGQATAPAKVAAPAKTAAQLASEFLVPGASNYINGDFVTGGLHTLLGLAVRSVLGFPGMMIVSANSFAKATTGRNLLAHLQNLVQSGPEPTPPAPTAR
jgi:hypothetical protein